MSKERGFKSEVEKLRAELEDDAAAMASSLNEQYPLGFIPDGRASSTEPRRVVRDALVYGLQEEVLEVLSDAYPEPMSAKVIAREIRAKHKAANARYAPFPRKSDVNHVLWRMRSHGIVDNLEKGHKAGSLAKKWVFIKQDSG